MRLLVIGAALALLVGCGGGGNEGGLTSEENAKLNEAAAMLDNSADGIVAPDETGLENRAADANATDDAPLNAQ